MCADGAVRAPFVDQAVCDGRLEVGGWVAVLGEELGEGVGCEEGGEAEDVGEAVGCHGEEVCLHVDY